MARRFKTFLLAGVVAAPLLAVAAETAAPPPPAMPADAMPGAMMHGKPGDEWHMKGKCCDEMQGKGCDMEKMGKMGHGMMMGPGPHMPGGLLMVPRLPPGNEKAQLQMEAEIHQKLAEILSKYADQLK